jgi:hypothetical protein
MAGNDYTRKPRPGDPDYVGYGHPPKAPQYKKGTSGNPQGRPKGAHRFKRQLAELLYAGLTLADGRDLSTAELVQRNVFGNLAKGNLKAVNVLIDLMAFCSTGGQVKVAELDAERLALLEQALNRQVANKNVARGDGESARPEGQGGHGTVHPDGDDGELGEELAPDTGRPANGTAD